MGPPARTLERLRRLLNDRVLATLSYAFLAFAFTLPLGTRFFTHFAGHHDLSQHVWNQWWVKKALVELGQSIYRTDYMYYPTGTSLASQSFSLLNRVIAIPLSYIVGDVAAYNVFIALSYILGGLGMYMLCDYIVKDKLASFVSGCAFIFSSFHVYHIWSCAHQIEWIPFFILYFLKALDEGKGRHILYAAIFFCFSSLSFWYFSAALLFFMACYLIYIFIFDRGKLFRKRFLRSLTGIVVLSLIFVLPFVYPAIKEIKAGEKYVLGQGLAVKHSADVVSFFVPGRAHPVFKDWVAPVYDKFVNKIEPETYLGYTVLILAVIGVLSVPLRQSALWIITALFFIVFSLGPHPQVYGTVYENIRLPYVPHILTLFNIDVFKAMRGPARALVVLPLSLSILAGFGLHMILCRIRRARVKAVVALLFTLVVFFEFKAWPSFPMYDVRQVPSFYGQLAEEKQDLPLLDIPLPTAKNPYPLLWQTVHEKKIFGGYVTRVPKYSRDFVEQNPFLRIIQDPQAKETVDISESALQSGLSLIEDYKVKYVVLTPSLLPPETSRIFFQWLISNFGEPAYKDNVITVFRTAAG